MWGDCSKRNAQRLERLQNQAMRIILSANRKACTQDIRAKLALLSLVSRGRFIRLQFVYKIVNNINCLQQLVDYLVKRSEMRDRSLRDSTLLHLINEQTQRLVSLLLNLQLLGIGQLTKRAARTENSLSI